MASESVRGLDRFRERFAEFEECYVLIGGVAGLLLMQEEELPFRATKDLDIILCVEVLDERFFETFWKFVLDAGYAVREQESGERQYYRFGKPADKTYPEMLELFSRQPDGLVVPPDARFTPIPTDSDVSSLSAILLDDDYYGWVMSGSRTVAGIRVVGPEHLIPLKARAFLDLSARRENEGGVDSRDVNKHRFDVARLAALLTREPLADEVPAGIRDDVRRFLESVHFSRGDLKNIKAVIRDPTEIVELLRVVYGLVD